MKRFGMKAALAAFVVMVLALPSLPALALLVRPIMLNLTSTGSGANGQIEVVNDRNRPIAVEVRVNRLTLPERGDAVLIPDDGDDFQIFPPIASIAPGERQVFRIRWIGEPSPAESQLYMFSTSELPVSATPTQAQVEVLYAINSVVTVRSPAARADVTVAAIERGVSTGDTPVPGLFVTFTNDGASHGFLGASTLRLTGESGWSHTVAPDEASRAFGLGLLPPNSRRTMFLPLADVPTGGAITASVQNVTVR